MDRTTTTNIDHGVRLTPEGITESRMYHLHQTAEVRLFISVCSGREWKPTFGYSLAALMLKLAWDRIDGRMSQVSLVCANQANICVSRQDHIRQAMAKGFTHFLSLDDDMTFPDTVVDQMIAHDKDVVTVNYRKKEIGNIIGVCGDEQGRHISSDGKVGLEKVFSMGMGVTLLKLSRFQHVSLPFFAVVWNSATESFIIEDGVFSAKLRDHFIDIWCDHDLSRQIGHIGDVEMRLPPIEFSQRPQANAA